MNIVTHGGKAHRDEFLSCCLLLHAEFGRGKNATIERRAVTKDDLDNDTLWVVDVGGVYNPDQLNFDHHHTNDQDQCSLDMIVRHLYGDKQHERYRDDNAWLRMSSWHDNGGANLVCAKTGMRALEYRSLHSPVEAAFLELFGQSTRITIDSPVYFLLREVGRHLHSRVMEANADVAPLFEDVTVVSVDGLRVLDVRAARAINKLSNKIIARYASIVSADVSVTPCSREPGAVSLYRFPWAERKVDFSKAAKPDVRFSHASGHYALLPPGVSDSHIVRVIRCARQH